MKATQAPLTLDPLRTVEEVRVRFGYETRQGVYDLIDSNKLKAERFPAGKKVRLRIRESSIQLYIKEYTIPDALPLPVPDQGKEPTSCEGIPKHGAKRAKMRT